MIPTSVLAATASGYYVAVPWGPTSSCIRSQSVGLAATKGLIDREADAPTEDDLGGL